jgi:hypothetical protein
MITIGIILLTKSRSSNSQIKEDGEVLDIIEMQTKAIPEFNHRLESSLYHATMQKSNDRKRLSNTIASMPSEMGMFDFMVSLINLVFIIIQVIFHCSFQSLFRNPLSPNYQMKAADFDTYYLDVVKDEDTFMDLTVATTSPTND